MVSRGSPDFKSGRVPRLVARLTTVSISARIQIDTDRLLINSRVLG